MYTEQPQKVKNDGEQDAADKLVVDTFKQRQQPSGNQIVHIVHMKPVAQAHIDKYKHQQGQQKGYNHGKGRTKTVIRPCGIGPKTPGQHAVQQAEQCRSAYRAQDGGENTDRAEIGDVDGAVRPHKRCHKAAQ